LLPTERNAGSAVRCAPAELDATRASATAKKIETNVTNVRRIAVIMPLPGSVRTV
jgi:hypothetical protein